MNEKMLKEIHAMLKDITKTAKIGYLEGPKRTTIPQGIQGPVADPSPVFLLDKAKVARLKIRRLDLTKQELMKQIDLIKLESDLLKKEYKIR